MNYENIAEVYAANHRIRENLKNTLANISDERANFLPEGEKWTIAALVEHLAMVEFGMTQISAKLLSKAQAEKQNADGHVHITREFAGKAVGAKDRKFEAPDRVQPTGTQTIAESLQKMEESRQLLIDLRPMFESVGVGNFTFPHPAFGDLNAHEWLALIGGHEARHIEQILRLLEAGSSGR